MEYKYDDENKERKKLLDNSNIYEAPSLHPMVTAIEFASLLLWALVIGRYERTLKFSQDGVAR